MGGLRHGGGQPDSSKNRCPDRQAPTRSRKVFTKSHLPFLQLTGALASLQPDARRSIDDNSHGRGEFQSRLLRDALAANTSTLENVGKPPGFSPQTVMIVQW
jgi:hypothetical protein